MRPTCGRSGFWRSRDAYQAFEDPTACQTCPDHYFRWLRKTRYDNFVLRSVDYLRKRGRWVGLNFRGEEGLATPGQISIPHRILTPSPIHVFANFSTPDLRQTAACHTPYENVQRKVTQQGLTSLHKHRGKVPQTAPSKFPRLSRVNTGWGRLPLNGIPTAKVPQVTDKVQHSFSPKNDGGDIHG